MWVEARAVVPEMLLSFFMIAGLYFFLKKRFIADGINPIKITAIGNVDDETAPKENMVETMLIN